MRGSKGGRLIFLVVLCVDREGGTMEHCSNKLAETSSRRASILCADAELTAVPPTKTWHCAE